MPRLSPVNQARWARFRHNRRGYWSLWIFAVLFVLSLFSELIANDKPLLVHFNDRWYVPVIANYSESDFGGPFATPAEYQDPWLRQQIEQHGWALWAPVRFGANSINFATTTPFPSPPSAQNWLGTDANGGDVLARILYGTRISLLFGLMLTIFSSVTPCSGSLDLGAVMRPARPTGPHAAIPCLGPLQSTGFGTEIRDRGKRRDSVRIHKSLCGQPGLPQSGQPPAQAAFRSGKRAEIT